MHSEVVDWRLRLLLFFRRIEKATAVFALLLVLQAALSGVE